MKKINIDHLSEEELRVLNQTIVEKLKFIGLQRSHDTMLKFSVGEKVSFHPPGREVLTGVLAKYNKKTVTVVTENGESWNVAPSFLMKVVSEQNNVENSNNIIELKRK